MAAGSTHSKKAKGRKFQQWVRDLIRFTFDLEKPDVESRSMGSGGIDIMLSSKAREVFPYAIECKNQERLNVWEAYKQAVSNTEDGLTPILFMKRNHTKPLVVIDAEYFVKLHKDFLMIKNKILHKE